MGEVDGITVVSVEGEERKLVAAKRLECSGTLEEGLREARLDLDLC